MPTKIQKWGNSLGVRLPKLIADQAKLSEDTEVEIEHKDGSVIITPVTNGYDLKTLLAGINEDNLQKGDDDFTPEGQEVW